jgi:anti-sigma factor RsiW
MNATPHAQDAEHDWAQQSLPWLVNGTLPPADALRLKAHLEVCAECRADHSIEQAIAQRVATVPVVDYTPQASLAKLMQRIDSEPAPVPATTTATARGRRTRRLSPWATAFMAQTAAVVVVAVSLAYVSRKPVPAPAAEFRTLSSAPVARAAHLQVVFAEALSVAEQRAILDRVQGQIIEGPSPVGMFLIALPRLDAHQPHALEATVAALRATEGVRFVALPPAPVSTP